MELQIDPEFKAAIQPLSPEELTQLEANIQAHGCRDPLVTWNDFIVDGHHRFEICQRLDVPFQTVSMDFPDRSTAKVWMLHNQLGRRNLNDFQRSEIALQLEEMLKEQGKERQGTRADLEPVYDIVKNSAQCSESDTTAVPTLAPRQDREKAEQGKTRDAIAKTAGVSHDTIKKVKSIQSSTIPEVQNLARSGALSIHAAAKIADLSEEMQEEIAEEITSGTKPSTAIKSHVHVHVAQNSGENEWYTPPDIIECARKAMGNIDCDPASSLLANETVKAAEFFTKDDDGLSKKWHGNVWVNPPYAQPLIAQFAEAAASKFEAGEFQQSCILVNNATETQWFQRLLSAASGVCFPSSRIRFLSPDGKPGAPLQGQAIFYLGDNFQGFADAFVGFGTILSRWTR
jgi:phage N-6-adenine-methyltransferase